MAAAILTAERLRELLHYDPETGVFTRRVRTSNRIKVGDIAGTLRPNGYLKASVLGKDFLCHRLAWLYVTGEWPKFEIDHINCIPSDNRIVNLRDVPNWKNRQNERIAKRTNKSSGLLGVSWHGNRWEARICVGGGQRRLGLYATAEEAHQAYLVAKRKFHEGCTI